VGTFLGDGEEAGGVGPRWDFATKDELDQARMEGTTVRPPGAGIPGGLRGELRGLPREGFGVLANHFMRVLLHYYKVELHHLAPNSISQATIFTAVCKGYLGMEPQ
jgi:hypothetical protein